VVVGLSAASHGALDALTNGGLGIALLSPFSNERFFSPWRPILVSPISVSGFLTGRAVPILASELVFVWLPALVLGLFCYAARQVKSAG
jgi:inner membrane protein